MIRAAVIAAFVGGVAVMSAQSPAPSQSAPAFDVASIKPTAAQAPLPAFEVASVKPSPPEPPSVRSLGGLRLPPGRWRAMRQNLVQLIRLAYPDHAFNGHVVGGPAWVRNDLFDIDARMDPKTTLAKVGPLLAQLLAERFALRTHTEPRLVDVYLLTLARDDGRLGPGLKRSDPSCVQAKAARQPPPRDCRGMPASGGLNLPTSQIPEFLRFLAFLDIDRPVLDRTGLTDFFDFQLSYQCGPFTGRFGGRPCGADGVSIFTALQEQAGLKLERAREVVDVLVIDSVEELTPN